MTDEPKQDELTPPAPKKRGRPKGAINVGQRKLTPQQESELIRRFGMGQPITDLAPMFNLSRQGVYNLLARNNVPYKKKPDGTLTGPTSFLPIPTKSRIVNDRLMGKTVRAIAQEQKIHRHTVDTVLHEAGVPEMVEQGKVRMANLIPKAIEVVEEHLDAQSLEAAQFTLKGTGVVKQNESGPDATPQGSITVNMALFDPSTVGDILKKLAAPREDAPTIEHQES